MTKSQSSVLSTELENFFGDDYLADEADIVARLLPRAHTSPEHVGAVAAMARTLVHQIRAHSRDATGMQAFLRHYDLSSQEGVVLMCLAEAMLRIPDEGTLDDFIADKVAAGNWHKHLGESESLFVNASTWALMLTGKLLRPSLEKIKDPRRYLSRFLARAEEPVVRASLRAAMKIMAHQFVMGRTIEEALTRAAEPENRIYRYSFDMLGEAALTRADADRYHRTYADAIAAVGRSMEVATPLEARPSLSVKLSALCPRYDYRQAERAVRELSQRLLSLAQTAASEGVCLTVDAEEAERLELSLEIVAQVFAAPQLEAWTGLGLAVQAYQKRAFGVLQYLNHMTTRHGKSLHVRLVKGAYWDTEIKRAQQQGLDDYPVFTRKSSTDLSYRACVRYLFDECPRIYPQFATHNAATLAYAYCHAGTREYEFQRLHGMGDALYGEVVANDEVSAPCRVYAPVGAHRDLLPYLVRRLLENGANTSFVNQIADLDADIEALIADPVEITMALGEGIRNPRIPLPSQLFGKRRRNSSGLNFASRVALNALNGALQQVRIPTHAAPVIDGVTLAREEVHDLMSPADGQTLIGNVAFATRDDITNAIDSAYSAWATWSALTVKKRAQRLLAAADLFESHRAELLAMCVYEAGKTLPDGHDDIREAIDFLRYYADTAIEQFAKAVTLPGPTGEKNTLRYSGRGVFLCISPWNFPVAIFTGQIAAALVTGNTVIAKPAEQASLTAASVVRLLHEAGVPHAVVQFLPAIGERVGEVALADPRIAGVAFTGSTQTANIINAKLNERPGPIVPLIAETGGQNAMIVDSSALPEQVVHDVVRSAFNSAGQRCSALRVLYLQIEIAARVVELLKGSMNELVIGDPAEIATDIGPVIDSAAQQELTAYIDSARIAGRVVHECKLAQSLSRGCFVAPTVIEIDTILQLEREHFGPILHLAVYAAEQLDRVIDDINACGFGLTLGIHTRVEHKAEEIRQRALVGNVYLNRDMIGAVVGVQPFGGRGLSGTGPKAGGPHYLQRFVTEQTYSVNTAAVGGNASLFMREYALQSKG